MLRSTSGLCRQAFNLIGEHNLLRGSNPLRSTANMLCSSNWFRRMVSHAINLRSIRKQSANYSTWVCWNGCRSVTPEKRVRFLVRTATWALSSIGLEFLYTKQRIESSSLSELATNVN